jgi:hypothetical protein
MKIRDKTVITLNIGDAESNELTQRQLDYI